MNGWNVEKLATLVNVVYGKSPAEIEKLDDGFPIFGTGGVVGYTSEVLCDGPSIILGRKGTIDKVQRCTGPFWAIDTTYYTTAKRQFDWSWLYYAISSFDLRKLNEASGVPSLSRSSLEALDVATPPLPEQQKIAAILTAVDDKLDVVARQIEATQTLKQGLMQTLFSRGVGTQDADGCWVPHAEFKDSELGEIPLGWTVAPLGELIEKLMDFRGRTPKKLGMEWGGGDIPALSANNVRMGYIDFDRECYLGSDELYAAWMVQGDTRKNDLVFTMEAPLGNVAVIPDDRKYILSQRVVLLRANQCVKHSYLFQYLRSDTFGKILEANSTGTTAKGIQQKRLVQLPVVVPPPEEQGRIADMLGAIDSKLDALLSKQSHHQTLKRGLMQKLLTGKWRVSADASATGV
ncbi:restriction endonuclease subunit S [Laribacter hongkongensis]|uniref:restriction endonuclease subunit S n=1 Tax=Laribacter hongkongensis TaxID=168471 RepID=UPI001EFCB4CA|nr:restriction endonuclease subunit S [Laribacter hongkongensis]MCG9031184.1 restriction endonuclease subunit S [Laribacter hongkongensis]MCG9092505.1 restriction endonuclease subunit S [Laribacter hongkongensis]